MGVSQILLHLSYLICSIDPLKRIVFFREDSHRLSSSNCLILKNIIASKAAILYLKICLLCYWNQRLFRLVILFFTWWKRSLGAGTLIKSKLHFISSKHEVRFPKFLTVKFWFLQIFKRLKIIVLGEVLLRDWLVLRLICTVDEILLSHFKFPICLCRFQLLNVALTSNKCSTFIKYLLICRFIIYSLGSEVEVRFTKLFFNIIVLLLKNCWSRLPQIDWTIYAGQSSLFVWTNFLNWIANCEMAFLDFLSNLFVLLSFIWCHINICEVWLREGLFREFYNSFLIRNKLTY